MTTIVYSTDSVDTSAVLLAQTLDDVLFTKAAHEDRNAEDEITDALQDIENQVIFYGVVNIPEWLIETYNTNRMFNDPRLARALLRRNDVIDTLGIHGVNGRHYHQINRDTNYTRLRERLGRRFDLVMRTGMTVIHTVNNSEEFNAHRERAHFACRHLIPTKKIRIYLGLPSIVEGGLLGASISEKRKLTFQEQLSYGVSVDIRNHIQQQFNEGILTEAMGENQEQQEAWTEQTYQRVDDIDEELAISLKTIGNVMHQSYNLDFCSLDLVGNSIEDLHVTNCTASPSLSNDTVLEFVSDYFKELLVSGRVITREQLTQLIQNLSEDQMGNAINLLRREGILNRQA